jgi:hypothetical protein
MLHNRKSITQTSDINFEERHILYITPLFQHEVTDTQ